MRLLKRLPDGGFSLTPPLHDDKIPPYAILSHTWGDDDQEITFDDILERKYEEKEGYKKLTFCADQAAKDGIEHFWVDTCCIRKSSDAELTEAINSMYRWYRDSTKCYVYLSDVSWVEGAWPQAAFEGSRWFTRGWTLQELIAPLVVQFFDANGRCLGSKKTLRKQISEITHIAEEALVGMPLSRFRAETVMGWAERRQTTRKEDAAYCMLGMFGVYMPLIYGEEDNALLRLKGKLERKQYVTLASAKALEESLKFEHIEDRYNNIRAAHADTCKWIFDNNSYQCWLDDKQIARHHGLLWLKGKPGSGKSTLIKSALSANRYQRGSDIHLSFFFNARGTFFEKDTLGMYRSLLFQMLKYVPRAGEVFEECSIFELPQAPTFAWTIPQLQNLLKNTLRKLEGRRLWIYVDALDECGEDQIRDMVAFFRTIGEYSMRAKIGMRVFFASRYYPQISTPHKVELRLEDEQEHKLDIVRFVNSELGAASEKNPRLQKIREEVIERASGVFIWVYLVVRILNKAYDHGDVLALERKLEQIPNDLSLLFKEVLARDGEKAEEMKLCVRWVLLARRPLTPRELYFAVHAGVNPLSLRELNSEEISDEVVNSFILSISRGLTELTESNNPVVQFIHETIREFFLQGDGVQHIQGTSTQSLLGIAHDSMVTCCITYMAFSKSFLVPPSSQEHSHDMSSNLVHDPALIRKLPFLAYSLLYCLYHANAAEANSKPQDSILRSFDISSWIHMTNVLASSFKRMPNSPLEGPYEHSPDWNLLYIIARQDLRWLLTAWKRVDPSAELDQGAPFSPIRVALEQLNRACVRVLITKVWAFEPTDYSPTDAELTGLMHTYFYAPESARSSLTISHLFFQWGSQSDILTLLRCGTFALESDSSSTALRAPLVFAANRGYDHVTKYLLEHSNIDCNQQDYLGFTPLMRAAQEGRSKIVSVLLQSSNVSVNIQCNEGRTALSYAAANGQEATCQALLQHPQTQINMRDKKGRTPFFYACMAGQEAIVKLFSKETAVDVISEDSMGHTALSYAAMNGHENIATRLLRNQNIQVNSQDRVHGRTPLIFAIEYKYYALAKLLLAHRDIDVSICTKRGRSALDYARDVQVQGDAQEVFDIIKSKMGDSDSDPEFSCDEGWELE
ncbi:hypothetical protein OPT61_g2519 [Boeremia exigua]|uniref:Uncharacterized protein n=1 Tax=Boeremia exigua TaxID=749465 RepID=A0ACC2IL75_9PLEO|nr:hypothetical protein OPT61_g2519 [Boeremia exigua]